MGDEIHAVARYYTCALGLCRDAFGKRVAMYLADLHMAVLLDGLADREGAG